jgi:hypothetical protein
VLKRWAGETASGVFVHVDESLHGMDVIRAFGAVDYFIQVGLGAFWCGGCLVQVSPLTMPSWAQAAICLCDVLEEGERLSLLGVFNAGLEPSSCGCLPDSAPGPP